MIFRSLDIMTIEGSPRTRKSILKKLNDLYIKLAHIKKDKFLCSFDAGTNKVHKATLTLLPHQTLIIPETYRAGLEKTFLDRYRILNDEQVR